MVGFARSVNYGDFDIHLFDGFDGWFFGFFTASNPVIPLTVVYLNTFVLSENLPESTLTHQGGFVEATKDEFEFAGISVDIAYGINTRDIGLVVQTVVYFDGVFFNFQSPICDGAQFGGEAKKGNKIIDSMGKGSPLKAYSNWGQMLIALQSGNFGRGDDLNFVLVFEGLNFFYGIECPPKFSASVN